MNSSPGTPSGAGFPAGSSTYSVVFAIGAPSGTGPSAGTGAAADQMVVSVGP